jgi:predicted SprT family Zn-dependent metalloprotease
MAVLRWLWWYIWTCRRCQHEPEAQWRLRCAGRRKALYCRRCGKQLFNWVTA